MISLLSADDSLAREYFITFPKTPVSFVDLPFSHILHSYHHVSPWDTGETRLLFNGFDETSSVTLGMLDLASGRHDVLDCGLPTNYHAGCFAQWALKGNAVIYNAGETGPVLREAVPPFRIMAKGPTACSCRSVSTDGGTAYLSRVYRQEAGGEIFAWDLNSGRLDDLVHVDTCARLLPREDWSRETAFFNHPVPNRNGDRLFFKLMKPKDPNRGGSPFDTFFTMDLGSGKMVNHGRRISGHPVWDVDDRHILNIENPNDGSTNRWIVRVNADTTKVERELDNVVEGPGHLTLDATGRWLFVDAFTDDKTQSPLYRIDRKWRTISEIGRMRHLFKSSRVFQGDNITRGQPHPALSPSGRYLAVNGNAAGSAFRLFLIETEFPEPLPREFPLPA